MLIQKDAVVTMRYMMKDDSGDILEDTINSAPVKYIHGNGNILPSLELILEGLTAGAQKSFTVHEKQWKSPLHFEVMIEDVRAATSEEIEKGQPNKDECRPGCCC
jgi:FKBP-type peptidyl-prolyl cis-trans isomerase SlyD